jgi:hypothetical protein
MHVNALPFAYWPIPSSSGSLMAMQRATSSTSVRECQHRWDAPDFAAMAEG